MKIILLLAIIVIALIIMAVIKRKKFITSMCFCYGVMAFTTITILCAMSVKPSMIYDFNEYYLLESVNIESLDAETYIHYYNKADVINRRIQSHRELYDNKIIGDFYNEAFGELQLLELSNK